MTITTHARIKYVPAYLVTPGMTVHIEGASHVVEASIYDRHGGGPNKPHQLLICNASPDAHVAAAYKRQQHFGLLPSNPVRVLA